MRHIGVAQDRRRGSETLSQTLEQGASDLGFLGGSGELAGLIRAFDWGATPLGPIAGWSQSLKTATGLLLRAPKPIVLLWGQEGVLIYNDAYAAFAGRRHPQILGMGAREGWPEIAEFNDNVIRTVLGGDPMSLKDQMLELDRNGQIEPAWLDLDYTPFPDEAGRPAGVMVFVTETTERVLADVRGEAERERQRDMLQQMPGFAAILSGPDHVFDYVNDAYQTLVGPRDLLGRSVREAFPELMGQGFYELLDQVYSSGERYSALGIPVALAGRPGQQFVDLLYEPIRNDRGEVTGIFVGGYDVTEAQRTSAALGESEQRYESLFNSVDEGFCIIDILFDDDARPFDYRFVEVNPAFERQTGLTQAIGRTIREFAPEMEQYWFDIYGRVALTGEPSRFEDRADALGRWYDVYAFRIGAPEQRRLAVLFNDISERKRVEGRQAALLELDQVLSRETEAAAVNHAAGRLLANALGAMRVGFGEIDAEAETIVVADDWTEAGVSSVAGHHRFRDYGSYVTDLIAGRPVTIENVETDPRTAGDPGPLMAYGIRALMDVPVVEENVVVAQVLVHSATPRQWTQDDIGLARAFAERTRSVAARRRAEAATRESERELQRLADNIPLLVSFVDRDERYRFNNEAYRSWFGRRPDELYGQTVRDVVGPTAYADLEPYVKRALAGERFSIEQRTDYATAGARDMRADFVPRHDEAGEVDGYYAIVQDIGVQKQAERRQAALIALTDALRDLTDPAEIAFASATILAEALGVTRAGYGTMDTVAETITIERDYNAPGISSIAGVLNFRDFGSYIEDLARGETVAIADTAADFRTRDTADALRGIGVSSFINMPLLEQGRVVALAFVNHVTPRAWSDEDIQLLAEVAARVRTAIERARASAELAESEARYRTLFDAVDEGFCIIEFVDGPEGPNSDYIHVEANRAAAEQAGLAGVQGRSVRELLGDEASEWVQLYSSVLETGRPLRVEHELKVSGRWLEVAAFRIEPPERRQVAVLFKDLTARKLAEDALRQSEAQFRAFAQAVPNHVWASRPDGELYWFNEQVYAYAGLSEGDIDGAEGWGRIVHPDDLACAGETWGRSLATGEPYQTEFRIRRADGAWRWFRVQAEPVRDGSGQITGWVGANSDIDDIRRQGDQLESLNAQLEFLLEGSKAERDRLWTLSADLLARADYGGGLIAVNPAWTRVLGWSEQELLTNPYADIIAPENIEQTVAQLTAMGETGQSVRFENRILSKDGVWTPMGWTVAPEPDGVHFIAVGRDLTEDKAREAALATAQEALRQSQKMEAVGQLTGGIAHDFNNLLAGISGALELLSKRLSEGRLNGMERYIDAAQSSAHRAASLTQRLLAFSRRQTLDPKPTDVNRLINGMEDLIRRSVGPDVDVEVVGAGGLWATRIDQSQLENALLNLCINARDAMAPDGGRLTIETSNKWLDERSAKARDLSPGQYVSLCVTDTGSGMTPEVQAQAFDPFFTTKPLGQGTGLGLSMIHGFVRQSGGQVRIYSEIGKGTTMCLYLPRYQGGVEQGEDVSETPVAEGGHGETVLVIDDEETVRMLVAEVLGDAGYNVIEAPDGPSGLDILRSDRRIDLLVSDVGLPGGMNGRQVADAARVTRPDLKVLFITGYAENAAVGNGLLAPGMEVLTKPFVMGDLAAKVHDMMEG